ncbi:FCD domain-containing protein [Streptomyces radicis]|uniref:FCD domain-containing protein n=1 Tax=Streptomyces radicis TaxID=1750517 RepID=A0A3A9WT01_9ACTN|nr:FCD domain-containing protein [Streptomyces radicis]RKN10906.1 FCD domain-containing protein [Streptomyces radicis]RKN25169.1 FCD domain-containing protein [Streptomyces radicis]
MIGRAAQQLDFPARVESDIMFHPALVAATGSSRLGPMPELIMGEVQLTMGQARAHRATHPGDIEREHAAIPAAIDAGNAKGAENALLFHLHAARDRLIADLGTE